PLRLRPGQERLDGRLGCADPRRRRDGGVLVGARGRLRSRALPTRRERRDGAPRRLREAQPGDWLGADGLVGGRRLAHDRLVRGEPRPLDRPRRLADGGALAGVRLLVTGGGGFLGSHLVARLEREGHEVVVARRRDYDLTRWEDGERLFRD